MAREIVLDTETTGLDPRSGHRLVEIACVELEDFLPTGRTFHRYIHPERPIDPEAERVHGLSLAFLADKPRFGDAHVCEALLEFIGEANVIAHNAAFDRDFVNR
jgi:DNA polymerase-3 subunit epsilon